jgi:hypothetical protein
VEAGTGGDRAGTWLLETLKAFLSGLILCSQHGDLRVFRLRAAHGSQCYKRTWVEIASLLPSSLGSGLCILFCQIPKPSLDSREGKDI